MPDEVMEIGELFTVSTDDQYVDEATKFPTVASGQYTAKLDTRETFKAGTNEKNPTTFGRQYARCSFPATMNGRKVGRVHFNLSWIEKRTATGRQDSLMQTFNQVKGALNMKGKNVGEVLEEMMKYDLIFTVRELYHAPEADPQTGRQPWKEVTTENRKFVNENQLRVINTVVGVRRVPAPKPAA